MRVARFKLVLLLAACGRDRASCPACDTAVIAAIGEPASILPPLVEESVGRDIGDQVFERVEIQRVKQTGARRRSKTVAPSGQRDRRARNHPAGSLNVERPPVVFTASRVNENELLKGAGKA